MSDDKPNLKQYGVWNTDNDTGYWDLYDSVEDAVSTHGDGCEVYIIVPKKLGTFKRSVKIVKIKKRKKKTTTSRRKK